MTKREASNKARIYHRYLGFFLAGIMAVYALSGVVLIFRDTDFLKREKIHEKVVGTNLSAEQLGKEIKIRRLVFDTIEGNVAKFKSGQYNLKTGAVSYSVKKLPFVLEKMTHLHKANSSHPLYFLNIFFGLALLFFVLSAFWMFLPKTPIFKKGLYFTAGGVILTLIMLFV